MFFKTLEPIPWAFCSSNESVAMKYLGIAVVLASLSASIGVAGSKICPDKRCYPKLTTTKEEKYCWKVETKQVCIPRVRFPWSKPCDPLQCGKVRTVRAMKKHTYESEKCAVEWEVVPTDCECAGQTNSAGQ